MSGGAQRGKYQWFPLVWLVLVVGVFLSFQFSGRDQDVKNTVCMLSVGAFFLGYSAWTVFFSPGSLKQRLIGGLFPWAIALTIFSLIEFENDGDIEFIGWRWRWGANPDEQLVVPVASRKRITDWRTTGRDYPRFLGKRKWAEVEGIEIDPDWTAKPLRERWRCDLGAGWSGFAIVGNYAVTQEQRGEQELVVCYKVDTQKPQGEIVWTHADDVRFEPGGAGALGGIGPRATPTIHDGRVLTMGATGIVNCLDARSGDVLWHHDTLAETQTANIMWGKASSPLVVEQQDGPTLVVVSVGAPDKSLVAYDLESGKEVWAAGSHRSSYASPVLDQFLGEYLILSVNEDLITAHRVKDGTIVWDYDWPGNSDSDATVSQPIPLPGDRLFLSNGYGKGATLLQLGRNDEGKITADVVWAKKVMKTKMGNVVIRDGFVYGLDGGILQCIDLAEGRSQWKKRRVPAIGHGQIMLVGANIVVLSESGELILVEATPEEYRELAAMRVFPPEQVTWNNPAFSEPYLLLRNAQQAVCLEMPVKGPRDLDATEITGLLLKWMYNHTFVE